MMFAADGLLGEWLDFFEEEDGVLVLKLEGAEMPFGLRRVRATGRVRIVPGAPRPKPKSRAA